MTTLNWKYAIFCKWFSFKELLRNGKTLEVNFVFVFLKHLPNTKRKY